MIFFLHSHFELASRPQESRVTPQPLNLGLPNWSGDDYAPIISPDGRYLIFQSDRPGYKEGANLWFSINQNYRNPSEKPRWTMPLPLFFPMQGRASGTMRVLKGRFIVSDPPGAFSVNSSGFDGMPYVRFVKGRPIEMYFTSHRMKGTRKDPGGRKGFDGLNIYYTSFVQDRWTPPRHLNEINGHFNDRMPHLSPDGKRLYFTSDRPGGYGGYDIWYSERTVPGSTWSRPRNMGLHANSRYNEISPSNSPAGDLLFFSSDRPGGMGYHDLYVSRLKAGRPAKAQNLGAPFNSARDDECISFTADGLWAYFASDRQHLSARGEYDLYRAAIPPWLLDSRSILLNGLVLDGKSRVPLALVATIRIDFEGGSHIVRSRMIRKIASMKDSINFAIRLQSGRVYKAIVSAPGYEPETLKLDYSKSAPRKGTDRRIIVLQPIREKKVQPTQKYLDIQGFVRDAKTRKIIAGAVVNLRASDGYTAEAITNKAGSFRLRVPEKTPILITARAPGYTKGIKRFAALNKTSRPTLFLEAVKKPSPCLKNPDRCIRGFKIYFDRDRSVIKTREMTKLRKLSKLLFTMKGIRIKILGHADRTFRGKESARYAYNKKLSEARARAVQQSLIVLGVHAKRLILKGFGHLRPVCRGRSRACLAKNRRVEFRSAPRTDR